MLLLVLVSASFCSGEPVGGPIGGPIIGGERLGSTEPFLDSKPWIPSPSQPVHLSRSARHPEAVVGRELGGSSLLDPNLRSNLVAEEEVPATQKLILGDWIAQWDTTYGAWFFYNINTEESTWIKPKELEHVVFNAPTKEELGAGGQLAGPRLQAQRGKGPKQNSLVGNPGGIPTWDSVRAPFRHPSPPRQAPAQEKILLESTVGDFFGFNTTSFASRGVIGGIRDSFTGIYDNIVKDYVTDVYTDVIEGYTIATIKLFGWFFFGGFLIMKGALLNGLVEDIGGRSMGELSLTERVTGRARSDDGSPLNYTLPFMKDLELTFPVEESLMTCYRGRVSCLDNDLPKEVETLLTNFSDMREFFSRWVELFERVEHMVVEGEDGL